MRKNLSKFRFALLGILMCLISVCAIGQTQRTYSYTFTSRVWSSLGTQSIGGWDWTASGTSTSPYFGHNADNGQQFGSKSNPFTALTLTTNSVRGTISSVKVITSGASNYVGTLEVKIGGTNLMLNDTETVAKIATTSTEYEFTGSLEAGAIELIWNASVAKALYLKSIEVTYTPDPSFVDAPTFTPAAGNYYEPASVTLATLAEGATIYYTIDGTEPTTSSLLYQEPIRVDQTTTIKAIAVRDTNSSAVSTAVYTFPINVNTIADFKSQGISNSIYKLTTTAKVIYNNPTKKYLFIQDATGALVMYNYTGATYNAGDEITGSIYGSYSLYNGMNEMSFVQGTPALPEATAGTPVDAIEATIAQLKNNYAYYEGRLVTVKNVTFIGDKRFVQGEDTMAFHTQLATFDDFEVGVQGNITGLMVYNSTKTYPYQLFPRSVNDIELPIELPVVVDFDENPAEGWIINNVFGNNKWYIGQPQGFDNNKLYISSTNGLTNKYGESASHATFARFIKIPAVGAKLTFDARVNGEEGYDYLSVEFKGQTLGTFALNNEWNNYTINITPEMEGAGILQFVWQNDGYVQNQFPAAIDNISIIPVACAQVTNLNAAVDSTTATITWTAPEDQTAWTLEYKLANHSEWYSVNATTPSVVLNNLQGNSNYDMRVKANCGEESSVWTNGTFAVDCQNFGITIVRTDKQIGTGTTSNSNLPFFGMYEYSYSQQIFDAAEINAINGLIYSISFYCMAAPTAGTTGGIRIWLGTTTKSSFTSNTDYVDPSELTQVYYNSSDYNYTAGQWHTFVFDQPFAYDGINNLVVAYYEGKSGWNSSGFQAHSMSNKSIYHYNDNASKVSYTSPASATGTHVRPAYRSNVKLNMDMPTIACVDTISCPDLVSVEANELTPNTATIDWTLAEGSTQNNFVVEYKLASSSDWTVVPVQDATTLTLTNLNQLSSYNVRVKAICGENDYSNYATADFSTPGVCASVTGIASSNNANSTTLTWLAGGEEGAWTVEFRPVGTENWISLHVSIIPMTTLGGLVGNTDYEVRIKALCDAEDEANQSAWTYYYFTSGCAAVDIDYEQVFDLRQQPNCWASEGFNFAPAGSWYYMAVGEAGVGASWLMSPAINIPAEGTTYVTLVVPNGISYKLLGSYRGTALARFEEIYVGSSSDFEVVVEVPEIYKGRMVNFMLQNNADVQLAVSKVGVVACPFVSSQLAASNITTTSADLSWQSDARVSSWNLEYRVEGDEDWTSMEVSTNPYTLTGLEAGTAYQARVKTACNETYSNTITFTTSCPAVAVPYFEGFEAYTTGQASPAPDCWNLLDRVTSGYYSYPQAYVNNSSAYVKSGSKSLYFISSNTTPVYAVMPQFTTDIENLVLSFWYRNESTYASNGTIILGLMTDPSDASTFVALQSLNKITTMTKVEYDFSTTTYTGSNYYIAFKYQGGTSSNYYASIDDIEVIRITTCGIPSLAVNSGIATFTRSSIGGDPDSYDLQIEDEIVTGVQSPANIAELFPNLQANTEYEIAVRANCGGGDYSDWSAPVSFTTPCMAIHVPYSEGFEDYQGTTYNSNGVVPDCWNNYSTNSTKPHVIGAGQSYNYSSSNALSFYGNGSNYAILPALDAPINTLLLSFDFATEGSSSARNMTIGYITNSQFTESDFHSLATITESSSTYHTMSNYQFVLNEAPAEATNIVFKWYSSSQYSSCVDNLIVTVLPSCGVPTATVNGSTLTITPSSLGTPQSYDLHIDGFQDQTVNENTVDLTTVFTGLASGTTYQVKVRANCGGGDYSSWSSPVSFTTACGIASLPYTENFDSYTSSTTFSSSVMPNCWERTYTGTSTYYGASIYPSSSYSQSGNNSLKLNTYGGTAATYGDIYAVLPVFDAPIARTKISLSARKHSSSYNADFEIGVVTDINNIPGTFVSVGTISPSSVSYQDYSLELSSYTGEEGHIALRKVKPSSGSVYTYIDDIRVEVLPTCFAPESLSATLTDTSAVITWADSHSQNNYVVEYKEATAETWNTATTTEMTYTITGLTPSTDYNVRVKADCGEGDESEYATKDFTTYCLAYYFEEGELICPKPTDLSITGIKTPLIACEVNDPVTITVKNTGFVYPISAFTAHYVLNEVDTVTEPVVLNGAQIEVGQEMVYSFNTHPTYELGFNSIFAWVELEGVELENNYIYDFPYVVTPNTVPYVMNTVPEENIMGWNAFDENNDGITMNLRNRVISYSYNDTLAANDWMISPCFNLTAGTYNIIFDYTANSSLSEQFALYFGEGATPANMTQLLSQFVTVDDATHTATVPVVVNAEGTYNFGFYTNTLAGNMGFEITNIQVLPVLNVTITTDGNGTVNPSGVVPVNYGENLTLSIAPNEMYHLGGIFVDGVKVVNEDPTGAGFMLYTLENVTENHNVDVEFKLEFHIIKSVENVNTAYTDVPGYFIPAATDTLVDPDPFTANFKPSQHYHFVALELGIMSLDEPTDVTEAVVANEDGSYSYTIDTLVVANYYLNAIFERNKVNINYNVLNGKGYANDSEVLTAPESYTTVVDHSINGDIDTTVIFAPYTTGDVHSDYHIVDVTVDGQSQGVINDYTFTDISDNHIIDLKYGYQVNATIRNYAVSSLGSTELRGTIAPAQQLVAEGDTTIVTGTIQEYFHLYNLFVDGVDMINDVVVVENPDGGYYYTYTIDSTIANYNIEAVVKLDTVGIHYHIDGGQGYADNSGLLNEGDNYVTHINFGDSILSVVAPAPGYSIANYMLEGFNMGAIDSYQFNNVRREYYVHLTFVVNDIAIVTNAYGHGTITDGMNFTYNPETPVNYNFVATPEEGYHITSVMINGESQVVPVSGSFQYSIDNVSENYTFDVYFEANTYTVDASVEGAGMINPVGVQTVAYGSDMNFVATANEGSYIATVTVDGQSTSYTQEDNLTTTTIPFTNITANHTVTVVFQAKSYTITANVDENGHGTINNVTSISQDLTYGMGYVLNFVPEQGYHVSQILVDGQVVEVADSYQFVDVQANHNVVVSFAINEYTLTATSNVEACTITPAQTTANYGTTVNYTINVATGYHLVNVMDNGAEVTVVNNTFAIANINDNHVINANFEANTYVVTVNQPAHAVITPGTQTVAYGATPSYVIVPQAGYQVVSVTAGNALVPVTYVNGVGNFTLSPVHGDLTINAVVAEATFTITVLPSQGQGTVSPATNQTVVYGGNKVFTFTPAANYVIGDIIVDGVSKGALTSYTFVNVVANHTIQAVFEGNCMVPTNLSVDDVTATSAQLSWSNTGASAYTVRYQAIGESTYHETIANTNSCTINGLTADAIYYWSVKSNCGAGLESEYSYELQFITPAASACDAPTNLTVDATYFENVKVSWTSNAASFNLRCKRNGDDPSTYVYVYGVNGTEYTFYNLMSSTTYNWGVQTICNEATGNVSAWAESTFTTSTVGIASEDLSSIKVYSNLNNVYVVNESSIAIKDVKIYDIYGKLVYSGNATSNPEVISLNVANGNYVVKLDTENGVAVYKLAIIR